MAGPPRPPTRQHSLQHLVHLTPPVRSWQDSSFLKFPVLCHHHHHHYHPPLPWPLLSQTVIFACALRAPIAAIRQQVWSGLQTGVGVRVHILLLIRYPSLNTHPPVAHVRRAKSWGKCGKRPSSLYSTHSLLRKRGPPRHQFGRVRDETCSVGRSSQPPLFPRRHLELLSSSSPLLSAHVAVPCHRLRIALTSSFSCSHGS